MTRSDTSLLFRTRRYVTRALLCLDVYVYIMLLQGTYWYHSHFLNQYCDGLRGPFVVRDPQDPHADLYDIDDGGSQIWLS